MPKIDDLQFRNGTAATWTAANSSDILLGEPGYETDTGRIKIGDGSSPWNDLEYQFENVKPYTNLASFPATGVTRVIYVAEDTNLLYRWDGSAYVGVGGGGGATNLAATLSASNIIITSDTGTDAMIPAVDGTNAGLMTPTQKTALDGSVAKSGDTMTGALSVDDGSGAYSELISGNLSLLNSLGIQIDVSPDGIRFYDSDLTTGFLKIVSNLTLSRTWTLPDKSGTLATLDDITGGGFVEATETTGTVISFEVPKHYGITTAETGNITFSHTSAKKGIVQRMRHNSGTKPTIPSEAKLQAGQYEVGLDNFFEFTWISATRVNVTITQDIAY